MTSRIEQERTCLIAWIEGHQLPVGTRIDREMTADALMADFITPLLAELAALRSQDCGAREMRERIRLMFAENIASRWDNHDEIMIAAKEGKYAGTNEEALKRAAFCENEADNLLKAWKLVAALPLSSVSTEDGRDV